MKWYKQETKTHTDEKIRDLIFTFGQEGYGIYITCLELIAEKIDENRVPKISISDRVLREICRVSHQKLTKILSFFSQKSLIFSIFHDGYWNLECPNLLKRLDNWTKRSVVTSEQPSAQQEQEEEQEQEREKKKNMYSKEFEGFWSVYPRREGKGLAFSTFNKLSLGDGLFERIMSAVEKQKKSEQWNKDGGRYIPMPATWLNQRRWEDEGITLTKNKSREPILMDASQYQPPEFVGVKNGKA